MKNYFPLPRIDVVLDKLHNAKCMTRLDLRSTNNQVRMSDDDYIAATTFQDVTPNGSSCLLEMLLVGLGLCNVLATFP